MLQNIAMVTMAPSNVPPATAMTIANNFVWRVIWPCAGVAVVHLVVEDEGEKGLTHVEVAAEVNLEITEEEEEDTMIVEEVVGASGETYNIWYVAIFIIHFFI